MNDAASSAASLLPVALAQLPEASQSQIMTVLLGGAALLVIANQVMTLVSKLRAKPEPAEVQSEARGAGAVLSERVTQLHGRVDLCEAAERMLDSQIDNHERELSAQRERESTCAGKLHKRLDDLAAVANRTDAKVEEGMKHLTASVSEIRTLVISHRRNP